jgi:5-methylthioribose kinase
MALDIENFVALGAYLGSRSYDAAKGIASFRKLSGGVSNRTVQVDWQDGTAWVAKQALAKLRVSVDWFSNPERIAVEAKALRWLNRVTPAGTTPGFVFEDLANGLMVMEAIPEPHQNWKNLLLSGQIVNEYFQQFGLLLGTIHRQSFGSVELRREFAETTHFESLRLEPYYLYAARQIPEAAAFLNSLAAETLLHKDSLVHGDFSPKNTLIHRGKLILLDYEVFHFGDPAFDLGFALTHFLSKAHHLPKRRAALCDGARSFWQAYRAETETVDWGCDGEPRIVRHTLACLLARVAGKSPLEYLTPPQVTRQREAVLELIATPPTGVQDLIAEFGTKIEADAKN